MSQKAFRALIIPLGPSDAHPEHPIVLPPDLGTGEPVYPTHPIVLPPPEPGVPTHPIVIPPGTPIIPGLKPEHPIYLPPEGGGGTEPPRPTHPIVLPPEAGGDPHPEHPIYIPEPPLIIWGPNDPRPTPPIVIVPPTEPGEPPQVSFPIELPPDSADLTCIQIYVPGTTPSNGYWQWICFKPATGGAPASKKK